MAESEGPRPTPHGEETEAQAGRGTGGGLSEYRGGPLQNRVSCFLVQPLEPLLSPFCHQAFLQWDPQWLSGKESACQCRRRGFNSWVWEIPWRRRWQLTPVISGRKIP